MGHSRGCAVEDCDKYEKGSPLKTKSDMYMRGISIRKIPEGDAMNWVSKAHKKNKIHNPDSLTNI